MNISQDSSLLRELANGKNVQRLQLRNSAHRSSQLSNTLLLLVNPGLMDGWTLGLAAIRM